MKNQTGVARLKRRFQGVLSALATSFKILID